MNEARKWPEKKGRKESRKRVAGEEGKKEREKEA